MTLGEWAWLDAARRARQFERGDLSSDRPDPRERVRFKAERRTPQTIEDLIDETLAHYEGEYGLEALAAEAQASIARTRALDARQKERM